MSSDVFDCLLSFLYNFWSLLGWRTDIKPAVVSFRFSAGSQSSVSRLETRLYVNVHHVAFDGGSLRCFERDLWALYQASSHNANWFCEVLLQRSELHLLSALCIWVEIFQESCDMWHLLDVLFQTHDNDISCFHAASNAGSGAPCTEDVLQGLCAMAAAGGFQLLLHWAVAGGEGFKLGITMKHLNHWFEKADENAST